MKEVYLDNNATTRALRQVCEAVAAVLHGPASNASSAHSAGDRGRRLVRTARESLAALLGANSESLVFTSGGTESNNMVFSAATQTPNGPGRIVTTEAEHSSILKMCEHLEASGVEIVLLPVDKLGHVDLDEFGAALTPETNLVSVQWVNNETGVIQPVHAMGEMCRTMGVPFHTDAAQAVGKLEMDVTRMPVDFLSLTGHKFHAPAGVGATYARSLRSLRPILHGGAQERGLRAGTENIAGIAGIGKAAHVRRERLPDVLHGMRELRDRFEEIVFEAVPDVHINGDPELRVCNTSNLRFDSVDGEALVAQLDSHGIFCSQSSACTSQRPEPSYVLRAMGLSEEEAYSSVRFSFSELNTSEEVEYAGEKIAGACDRLRSFAARLRGHDTHTMERR